MTPTAEQLEAVAQVVAQVQGSEEIVEQVIPEDRVVARAAWDAIAPLVRNQVLEEMWQACRGVTNQRDLEACIGTLKVQP